MKEFKVQVEYKTSYGTESSVEERLTSLVVEHKGFEDGSGYDFWSSTRDRAFGFNREVSAKAFARKARLFFKNKGIRRKVKIMSKKRDEATLFS